ncbi:MAG TPA: carboxylesterase/lipase family protein [Polyangiales bacterium]
MKLIAETRSGQVEGVRRDQHTVFRGIPYALPPTGARRFSAPEPAAPWSGVRACLHAGPVALQGTTFASGMEVGQPESEDCLTLNVYTPALDDGRRPVLFWIHGGAFTVGASSVPLYDGAALCQRGDVVVVTVNYRLGLFGFLDLGEQGEAFGAQPNLGILDQLLALEWVRHNIAHFGGDPANVTVFGESAGATSVAALLIAPRARGLFRRAIAQSTALHQRLPSRELAARTTHAILAKLGVQPGDVARLRELPAETLVRAQREAERESLGWRAFFPVRHPGSLPRHPDEAHADPSQPNVPLIVGSNRDEWNLFDAGNVARWGTPLEAAEEEARLAQLARWLPRAEPAKVRALVPVYRESRAALGLPHDARSLLRAIEGDLIFHLSGVRLAEAYARAQRPVYTYRFTHMSPALRGALGACHALELPFVFGTYEQPMQQRFAGQGPAVAALSASMMRCWLHFAREGAPGPVLDARGQERDWPAYELERRPTLMFGSEREVALDPFGSEREAWRELV